jgi:hypothetical protein
MLMPKPKQVSLSLHMTFTMFNGKHFRNQGPATEKQRHEIQDELGFLRGALDSARSEISQLKDEVTALRELTLFLKVLPSLLLCLE